MHAHSSGRKQQKSSRDLSAISHAKLGQVIVCFCFVFFSLLRTPSRRLQPFSTPRPIRERYFVTSPSWSPPGGATTTPTPAPRPRCSTTLTSSLRDPSLLLLLRPKRPDERGVQANVWHVQVNVLHVQTNVSRVQATLCRLRRSITNQP